MKKFIQHLRSYMLRGLLAIIPIFLSVLAIQLLYVLIDKRVMAFLDRFIEVRQIPGLGILLVLACLYLIGMIVSNVIGRQFFGLVHRISERIPVVNAIYKVGKQISESLATVGSDKQILKKAVLVKINEKRLMVPAFAMSSTIDQKTGEEYLSVLVPTAPTPASGFVLIVKASEVVDPGWTVEECLKVIVSVGLIAPKEIKGNLR